MHYNLVNEAMSAKASVSPKAGMLGTMFVGSDRYTVVCLESSSPKRCKVAMHFPDRFLQNRFEDMSVQYIPEDDLKELIDYVTPSREKMMESCIANNMPIDADFHDWFKYEMKRFEHNSSYSLRKNGRWMPKGSDAYSTCSIRWGYGDYYIDPNF